MPPSSKLLVMDPIAFLMKIFSFELKKGFGDKKRVGRRKSKFLKLLHNRHCTNTFEKRKSYYTSDAIQQYFLKDYF